MTTAREAGVSYPLTVTLGYVKFQTSTTFPHDREETSMADPIDSHSMLQLVDLLEWQLDEHMNETGCA